MRHAFSLALTCVVLTACSTPQIHELRSQAANTEFQVRAPIACLYDKGVEYASSYIGMSEPKFTWHIDANQKSAWFRQPLTLIELRTLGPELTEVRRSQTASAGALGQGSNLLAHFKSNPCLNP